LGKFRTIWNWAEPRPQQLQAGDIGEGRRRKRRRRQARSAAKFASLSDSHVPSLDIRGIEGINRLPLESRVELRR
jgi:hypothetical protein